MYSEICRKQWHFMYVYVYVANKVNSNIFELWLIFFVPVVRLDHTTIGKAPFFTKVLCEPR